MFELTTMDGNVIRAPAYPEDCRYIDVARATDGLGSRLWASDFTTPERVANKLKDLAVFGGFRRGMLPPSLAADGQKLSYGEELIAAFGGGVMACIGVDGDYVRVVRDGREDGYWVVDEIIEAPAEVLGAFLGSCNPRVSLRVVA